MPEKKAFDPASMRQRKLALSRWENEGGAARSLPTDEGVADASRAKAILVTGAALPGQEPQSEPRESCEASCDASAQR